ncbi:hypothetical protein [Raoultella planticola]|uniref:hypothetical protein n=1 Tax=Raoultella planticola TaxID=575 RepID=UPI003B9F5FAF
MQKYVSEPIHYTTNIDFLYRWDSRPPEVINENGFQGAVNLYFNMIFGMRTVFCSSTPKGSEYYFKELEEGMSSYGNGDIYFLYKINARGLPAVNVYQNQNNAGFVKQFASRFPGVEHKLMDKEHAMPTFALLSRFNNYIDKVAIHNEEVQVLGPIQPWRITFLFSQKLSQEAIEIRNKEQNSLLLKQTDIKNKLKRRKSIWGCF